MPDLRRDGLLDGCEIQPAVPDETLQLIVQFLFLLQIGLPLSGFFQSLVGEKALFPGWAAWSPPVAQRVEKGLCIQTGVGFINGFRVDSCQMNCLLSTKHHAGKAMGICQCGTGGKKLQKLFVLVFSVGAAAVSLQNQLGIHQDPLNNIVGQIQYMLAVALAVFRRDKPVVKAVPEAVDLITQLLVIVVIPLDQTSFAFALLGRIYLFQNFPDPFIG